MPTTSSTSPELEGNGLEPPQEEDLPRWLRITLIFTGVVFLLIGIAMLAIPVVPQVWAFALSAVCFSVASPTVWDWLERKLRRWPKVHDRAAKTRSKLVHRFNRAPTPQSSDLGRSSDLGSPDLDSSSDPEPTDNDPGPGESTSTTPPDSTLPG